MSEKLKERLIQVLIVTVLIVFFSWVAWGEYKDGPSPPSVGDDIPFRPGTGQ